MEELRSRMSAIVINGRKYAIGEEITDKKKEGRDSSEEIGTEPDFPEAGKRAHARDELERIVLHSIRCNVWSRAAITAITDDLLDELLEAMDRYPYFADGPSVVKAIKAGHIDGRPF